MEKEKLSSYDQKNGGELRDMNVPEKERVDRSVEKGQWVGKVASVASDTFKNVTNAFIIWVSICSLKISNYEGNKN